MIEVTQPRMFLGRRFKMVLIVIASISVVLTLTRYLALQYVLKQARSHTFRLAQSVASDLSRGGSIDADMLEQYVSSRPSVGYLVSAQFGSGHRHGYFRLDLLSTAAPELYAFRRSYRQSKVISRLLQRGAGHAGEYLHVVSAALVPSLQTEDSTPLGIIKVGYVLPGIFLGKIPMGRGYALPLMAWYLLAGLMAMTGIIFGRLSAGKDLGLGFRRGSETLTGSAEDSEVTWLEHETGRTEPIYLDEQGRSWRLLLPDGNMDNWHTKGIWYVSGRDLVGRPWGSSAVRDDLIFDRDYIFQCRVMNMAGPDGFIILFSCFGYQLHWVIGGWANTRSEVAGYDSTSSPLTITKQEWYTIEIRVTGQEVSGHMNGAKIWDLAKHEITRSSPEAGFKGGLGVAVWNTLGRFTDIRFYQD